MKFIKSKVFKILLFAFIFALCSLLYSQPVIFDLKAGETLTVEKKSEIFNTIRSVFRFDIKSISNNEISNILEKFRKNISSKVWNLETNTYKYDYMYINKQLNSYDTVIKNGYSITEDSEHILMKWFGLVHINKQEEKDSNSCHHILLRIETIPKHCYDSTFRYCEDIGMFEGLMLIMKEDSPVYYDSKIIIDNDFIIISSTDYLSRYLNIATSQIIIKNGYLFTCVAEIINYECGPCNTHVDLSKAKEFDIKYLSDIINEFHKTFTNKQFFEVNYSENNIDLSPMTSTNINTSPSEKCKCDLKITLTEFKNGKLKGISGEKVEVKIIQNPVGILSSQELITNENGEAFLIYTAPTDEEFLKFNKQELEVILEAKHIKTGKTSWLPIHITQKVSKLDLKIGNEVIPANSDYYDEVIFKFNAPEKLNKQPYKVFVKCKTQSGAIVKNNKKEGGMNSFSFESFPNTENKFYYHWVGTNLLSPQTETITFEIPEINYKNSIDISVGIKIKLKQVSRVYTGEIVPFLTEPFYVVLVDEHHPDINLAEFFEYYNIASKLTLQQKSFQPLKIDQLKEEDIFARTISYFEGMYLDKYDNLTAVPTSSFYIIKLIKKDLGYCIIDETSFKNNKFEYPSIEIFERGKYSFDFIFDEFKGNSITEKQKETLDFEVTDFRDFSDEVLKTVFYPCIKEALSFISGEIKVLKSAMGGIFECESYYKLMTDFEKAMKEKDYNEMISVGADLMFIVGEKYFDKLPEIEQNKRTLLKRLLKMGQLAGKTRDLVNLIVKNKGGSENEVSQKIKQNKLKEVLRISHLFLKNTQQHYIIVINKTGFSKYLFKIKEGNELEKIADKFMNSERIEQRIEEIEDFLIIPAEKDEKIEAIVELNGNGGEIYVINKNEVKTFNYPKEKSKKKITFSEIGEILYNDIKDEQQLQKLNISGAYDSDFGTLTIYQNGNKIAGNYSWDDGKIEGELQGLILKGKWSEKPDYKPPQNAGLFVFTFSEDGKSFTGKWKYGYEDNNQWQGKPWNGKRK